MRTIGEFRDEHAFLSNFYEHPVAYDGLVYPSAEAAYQAAKAPAGPDREPFTRMTPGQTKRAGRRLVLREDWDAIRDLVMADVVASKFAVGSELASRLLATGLDHLVEGNRWHDTYWGSCSCPAHADGSGRNRLGQILMDRREALSRCGWTA